MRSLYNRVPGVPLKRRAKASSIKVLLAVDSQRRLRANLGRERVAVKSGLLAGGEVLGILAKAGTLGRTLPVIGGRNMKKKR